MKAIEFPEVNVHIAENQPEYETLPVHVQPNEDFRMVQITACFELTEEEKKQVAETGQLWFTVLQPGGKPFHPIMMSTLKPEML